MRIAMIGPFGLRPKATMAVRALPMGRALQSRGHEVAMFLPPWSNPEDAGREWEEDGVRVNNTATSPDLPLVQESAITWRLLRGALSFQPDVVHCFKPKAYAGLTAVAVWFLQQVRLTNAALVVDSDDWEGAGGWNEVESYSWLQRRTFAFQERWGLTHCDALTVASRHLQSIAWSLGVAPRQVFYVPNGVPDGAGKSSLPRQRKSTTEAVREEHNLGDDPLLLLYTRFVEFQVQRVVDILRRVVESVPDARLLIVGRGIFGEENELFLLVEEAGLAQHVCYAGWIEPEVLPAYLSAADAAIVPYDDTLINRTKCSVKVAELMAAGLPVVADAVGQNAAYLEDGVSGLLVQSGRTSEFARRVVQVLHDEDFRRSLGEAAQRRICETFTWKKLARRIEEAYATARSRKAQIRAG